MDNMDKHKGVHPVADPGVGAEGAMPPSPVKISHKKHGHQRQPHRFHVSRPPPLSGCWIRYWHQPINSESCPVVEGNNDIKHYKRSSNEGHVSNVPILGQFLSFLCGFWL